MLGQETKPPSSRAMKAMQTRARLVDAAKEMFQDKGFLETTVADIVKRAGVAHGTFYTYFQSREEVLREIAEQADRDLNAPMGQLILDPSTELTPSERIRAGIRAFLDAYRRQAGIMRVVEEVSHYDPHVRAARAERLRDYNRELARSIRSLQRRGMADRSLDPALSAALLGSITRSFPVVWLSQEIVDSSVDEVADHIATIFIRSLGITDSKIS